MWIEIQYGHHCRTNFTKGPMEKILIKNYSYLKPQNHSIANLDEIFRSRCFTKCKFYVSIGSLEMVATAGQYISIGPYGKTNTIFFFQKLETWLNQIRN